MLYKSFHEMVCHTTNTHADSTRITHFYGVKVSAIYRAVPEKAENVLHNA